MDVHSPSSRAGAAAVATALLLCTSLAAADAASSARATSATTAVTSGSWGAVATTDTAASGPLALTFTLMGSGTQYFNVVSTGTLPLSGGNYTATTTASNAVIEACSTTWNESNNRCTSGVITTVTTTGAGPTPFAAPLPAAGSSIRLRARITGVRLASTVTVSVEVSRTQARYASVTGS